MITQKHPHSPPAPIRRGSVLMSLVLLAALAARPSRADPVPFERMSIDNSVKDPWAKIIADMDGDGFQDLVIGGRSGPLIWYRYADWTKHLIAEGGYRSVDAEAGDVDGDGDLDVVIGGLLWYENPLGQNGPRQGGWKAHRVADHPTHDLALADLDGDGRLDIITRDQSEFGARAGNQVHLWLQSQGQAWNHRTIQCPHGEGLEVGDIDRDGTPDVVIGGVWFKNENGARSWPAHPFADWHPNASVQLADVNRDDRMDVILAPSELAGQWHRLSWFEAPMDPERPNWREHIIVGRIECVVHGLAAGDFNADGAVDVAASEMHQGQDPDEVVLFLNREGGAAWERQVLSENGSHSIQAGDMDSDADLDLMGANWSGPHQTIEWWRNQLSK